MNTTKLMIGAAAALTFASGAASAQAWLPMIERQDVLDARLDATVAAGELTPAEASLLQDDMRALVALEGRYRYGGLSAREKLELDRRYALIDDQVRSAIAVPPPVAWASMAERKLDLDARIARGLDTGQLTAAEVEVLREDFNAILQAEANYKVDGLSPAERADLNERFDELDERVLAQRTDAERRYGRNRY